MKGLQPKGKRLRISEYAVSHQMIFKVTAPRIGRLVTEYSQVQKIRFSVQKIRQEGDFTEDYIVQ